MKKTIFVTTMLAALLVSAGLLGGLQAQAVQVGSINSNADITFATDTSITSPVHPEDPTKPVLPNPDDTFPHSPGTAGPLSIDYVSNFHFGSQQVKALDAVYNANLDVVLDTTNNNTKINVPNYVQVTDKRGLNLGWNLTVKQNGQFTTGGATPSVLTGATLSLLPVVPHTANLSLIAPVASASTLAMNPTSGAAATVATAALSAGQGTWTLPFGSTTLGTASRGVTLTVPLTTAKVTGQQYTTSLTWMLGDTPI